jgi:hypothetical protein
MSKLIGTGEGSGYALAFGLSWHVIGPLDNLSEMRREQQNKFMRWEATYKVAGSDNYGWSKEEFVLPKGVKTLSGAAQIALHPKVHGHTVLVIMEVPSSDDGTDNLVAVVGVLNGNVVIDDMIAKSHQGELVTNFRERCKKAESSFTIIGLSISQGRFDGELTWQDFEPLRRSGAVGRFMPRVAAPLVPLELGLSTQAIALGVSGVLLVGSVWAYNTHSDNKKAAAANKVRQERESRPINYEKAVSELLSQPVLLANSSFKDLREYVHGFPTQQKGWRLYQVECLATGICEATWQNPSGLATNRDFSESAPKEWGVVRFDSTGRTLSHTMPFRLPLRRMLAKEKWPTEQGFLLGPFSQWQKYWVLKFEPTLAKKSELIGNTEGVDARAAAEYPGATWATAWTIDKTPWDLSEGFDHTDEATGAALPACVTVERIIMSFQFEPSKEVSFKANGRVYARK